MSTHAPAPRMPLPGQYRTRIRSKTELLASAYKMRTVRIGGRPAGLNAYQAEMPAVRTLVALGLLDDAWSITPAGVAAHERGVL